MPYRSSSTLLDPRYSGLPPAIGAVFPASIGAAVIGTVSLVALTIILATAASEWSAFSFGDLLPSLIMVGMAISLGSLTGTLVVLFYIVIFGFPVALLLGARIARPVGLVASAASFLVAVALANLWLGNVPMIDGTGQFDLTVFLSVLAFAVPAAFLYHRWVIAMRNEADLD